MMARSIGRLLVALVPLLAAAILPLDGLLLMRSEPGRRAAVAAAPDRGVEQAALSRAQLTPTGRPTLEPTWLPLTAQPVQTARAELTATARQATVLALTPSATSTPTSTGTPIPTVAAPTATGTASMVATSRPILASTTGSPPSTPRHVPTTGRQGRSVVGMTVIGMGVAFLCFVGGIFLGLATAAERDARS
ncbi:MAG TPA: hypothetical protein VER55_16760 [Ardenticatenaceae bacterium]|nr:hypothetical protein [Ardenticatenaceae bacterium]